MEAALLSPSGAHMGDAQAKAIAPDVLGEFRRLRREAVLRQSTDAAVWAHEWCEVATEIVVAGNGREVIDEGWMIGWFANAIETAKDHAITAERAARAGEPPACPHWGIDADHLRTVIGETIGEASMQWEHVERAGIFDSTEAAALLDRTLEKLLGPDAPAAMPDQSQTIKELDWALDIARDGLEVVNRTIGNNDTVDTLDTGTIRGAVLGALRITYHQAHRNDPPDTELATAAEPLAQAEAEQELAVGYPDDEEPF